jgi:hypothetical protein
MRWVSGLNPANKPVPVAYMKGWHGGGLRVNSALGAKEHFLHVRFSLSRKCQINGFKAHPLVRFADRTRKQRYF